MSNERNNSIMDTLIFKNQNLIFDHFFITQHYNLNFDCVNHTCRIPNKYFTSADHFCKSLVGMKF